MTTEDDFNRALDEHPDDWQTRLVFADWLQDRDDPRAEGYRVLARLKIWPLSVDAPALKALTDAEKLPYKGMWWWGNSKDSIYRCHQLPWWDDLPADSKYGKADPSRQEAEETAVKVWIKLTAERKQEVFDILEHLDRVEGVVNELDRRDDEVNLADSS